ncbi:anti-phage ZorAB system protein ZorA [Gracilimonas halophila]|uniref:Anti-phage ZorAB system protein ZorA n=1 Tax=Gracilimonas halophila TaxID=1834464 RepID=A0ABW5JFF8_9BACT
MKADKEEEQKQIDNLVEALSEATLENISDKHFLISEVIYKKYEGYPLAKHWKEFEESLVFNDDQIENTLDAGHFFNVKSLCPNTFENEIYKWVPSALIGVGVLFTFIGLLSGIWNLDVSSEDIDTLRTGVQGVINGAFIAFLSSILGIMLSLIFAYKEKAFKTDLRKSVTRLQNLVDFKYPRTNPEKSLVQIRDHSKSTEEHIGALSEKLGSKLQEVVRDISDDLKQGIQESLENSISPYMEQIANKAMNSSETAFSTLVDEFLEKVGDAGAEQQELIRQVNQEMQDALIEFREKFTDQVSGLKDSIQNLNESYHFIEENLITEFEGAINNLEEVIKDQQEIKDISKTQFNEQLKFVQETRDSLGNYLNNIKKVHDQLVQIIQSFNVATDNLEVTNSNNEMVNSMIAEASQQLRKPFSELNNEYEKMRGEVENNLNQISAELNKTMDSYFSKVEQQTNERMNEWNQQTYEFTKGMVDVTRQFNYVIEELNKNGSKEVE